MTTALRYNFLDETGRIRERWAAIVLPEHERAGRKAAYAAAKAANLTPTVAPGFPRPSRDPATWMPPEVAFLDRHAYRR